MKRRTFLKSASLTGGGILFSFYLPLNAETSQKLLEFVDPNAYLKIDQNSEITFRMTDPELGQGIYTGLAMIIAEELGVDLQAIKVERVTYSNTNKHLYKNFDGVGGSTTTLQLWNPLRKALAKVRALFILAAAQRWKLSPTSCILKERKVIHSKSQRSLPLGSLLNDVSAIKTSLVDKAQPKAAEEYQIIGQHQPSLRNKDIVQGKENYTIDLKLPKMHYAVIARCPVTDGKVVSFDDTEAKKIKGVKQVFAIESQPYDPLWTDDWREFYAGVQSGVAVVADCTWAALKGRQALKIEWDFGKKTN